MDWSCGLRNLLRVSDFEWVTSVILIFAIVMKCKVTWQMKLTGDSERNFSMKNVGIFLIKKIRETIVLGSYFKVPFHEKNLNMKTRIWSYLQRKLMVNFDPFTSKFSRASMLCYDQFLSLFNVKIVCHFRARLLKSSGSLTV